MLQSMGKHVFLMGGWGCGHAMKTLNDYTSAADAVVAGQVSWGLEPAKMLGLMNVGTGVNLSTKEAFRTDGLTRRYQSGY